MVSQTSKETRRAGYKGFALAPDVEEAFVSLLSLRPAEVAEGQPLVLTLSPTAWLEHGPDVVVVDLSDLFTVPGAALSDIPPGPSLFRPSSVEELCLVVDDHAPRHLILDVTLLLGQISNRWTAGAKSRGEWIVELGTHVPDTACPPEGRLLDATSTFLAWASGIESLQALSAIIPSGIARHPDHAWLRECLQTKHHVCALLELPHGLFPEMRWLGTTALFLGGRREYTLVDSPQSPAEILTMSSQPWFDRLQRWLLDGEPSPSSMVKMRDGLPWSRTGHLDLDAVRARLDRVSPVEALGALCEVENGKRMQRLREVNEGGIPRISRSTLANGTIDLDNATRVIPTRVPESMMLRPGDILLSATVTQGFAAIVNRSAEPAVIGEGVIVIRPRDPRVTVEYLAEYLNSSTAQEIIEGLATMDRFLGTLRLSAAKVRQIPVPLLDPVLFEGISQTEETVESLRRKADELAMQRRRLFDADNKEEFKRNLNDLRRRGNLFARGIERADSIAYQISNFYPFPIAFGYRLLAGQNDPIERYKEQLRIAENLLAFLGSVAIALVRVESTTTVEIDVRRLWRGGISPGDWKDVMIRTFRRSQRTGHPLAEAMAGLNIGSARGFGGDISDLIGAKNDFKHDRGPTTRQEYLDGCEQLQERLDRCMEHLAFFTDFPVRQLQDYEQLRRGGWTLEYLNCVGDHPGLEQRQETVGSLPMELPIKGEMYITIEPNRWFSLFPFMSILDCPHCRAREVYFIDRWDERRGKASLKSFDRGHTENDVGVAAELALWPQPAGS